MAAAGLPVELQAGGTSRALAPGLDLAAYRVVQEALTNVIKHAGKPRTTIRLDYGDAELVVEVADAGRLIPAAGPAVAAPPGSGRGLLGLRERVALYGGELDAGPRPGGGWLVRARLPLGPPAPAPAREPPGAGVASPTAGLRWRGIPEHLWPGIPERRPPRTPGERPPERPEERPPRTPGERPPERPGERPPGMPRDLAA